MTMSWYRDPQLFIYQFTVICRIRKEFGSSPVMGNDAEDYEPLDFSKHLSLGNNKETDYDDFKASFDKENRKFINCQGLVINWDITTKTGTWSLENLNSPFWSLPGITKPASVAQLLADKQALEGKVSDLEEINSELEDEIKRIKNEKEAVEAENDVLKTQVKRDRDENSALEGDVSDLEANISTLEEKCERVIKEKEAENAVLQVQVNRERDEKEALNARVLDLEAGNGILEAEIYRERDEKDAINENVLNLKAKNTILKAEIRGVRDEKEAISTRVLDLEAENAILKADQVNRETYVSTALKGEDILAGLEALEKKVSGLTSKLMFPQ